jgi:hypothetical protein
MSGQDYPKRLDAGSVQNMNVPGDYIYCKSADRAFTVILDGKRTGMEAGDKMRPGSFTQFEIQNDDEVLPLAVILNIGVGDFNRQIIKGEITSVPGVIRADGSFNQDTRRDISMTINPVYKYPGEEISVGDVEASNLLITGAELQYADMKCLKLYQGIPYIRVGGNSVARNGLYSVLPLAGGFVKESVTAGTFNTDNDDLFAFCDEVPGGFLFDWVATNRRNRIRYYDPQTTSYVEVVNSSFDIDDFDYDPQTKQLFVFSTDGSTCKVYDVDGVIFTLSKTLDLSYLIANSNYIHHAIFNRDTRQWTLNKNASTNQLDFPSTTVTDEFFNLIQVYQLNITGTGIAGGYSNFWVLDGGSFYGWERSDGTVNQLAANFSQLTLRGFAAPVSCDVTLIDPSYDSFTTTANVTLTDSQGQTAVAGEVIKAALELFYRARIGEDYLDSVFAVTFFRPLSGAVMQTIGSKGSTLARQGIEDDFNVYFPSRIDLTVDATLPLIY